MRNDTMFYVVLKRDGEEPEAKLYHGSEYKKYCADTFCPLTEELAHIVFSIRGRSWADKQNDLRELAIFWQQVDSEYSGGGLSMWGYAQIGTWFEKMGKKYGLLREFRENGIC